jgi:hypothetical protein
MVTKYRPLLLQDIKSAPIEGFVALPIELHHLIIQHLGFIDTQALRISHPVFRSLIKAATFTDLLAYERDPTEHETCIVESINDWFGHIIPAPRKYIWVEEMVCGCCLKLKWREDFHDWEIYETPEKRICTDCSMRWKRTKRGFALKAGRLPSAWCGDCGSIDGRDCLLPVEFKVSWHGSLLCRECDSVDWFKGSKSFKKERAWKSARKEMRKKGEGWEFDVAVGHVRPWNGPASWSDYDGSSHARGDMGYWESSAYFTSRIENVDCIIPCREFLP